MRRANVVILLAMMLPAAAINGQRPVQLSLAGGASAPQGTLSDATSLGWHVLGAVDVNSLFIPLGLRLEGAYNRITASDDAGSVGGDVSIVSITGNATYRWPMTNSTFSPYLIGGMGAYQTDCETVCEGSTSFGWNFGVGTRLYLVGLRSFLEARFHSTTRAGARVNYVPVSLGITF